MDVRKIVAAIVEIVCEDQSVEGAFLSGSLVNADRNRWSDIDLGIVSKDTSKDFERVYSLREQIMRSAGRPLHFLERGWQHCRMVAILYGKSQFPPVGLEIDLIVSRLRHVSEQMPYAEYEVVFDRAGRLRRALERLERTKPKPETREELAKHLTWFPFYVHDALKAWKRGDAFHGQSLLEEMRTLLFFAAALREGAQVHGSKRAYRYLSPVERQRVTSSYREFARTSVKSLTEAYLSCLREIQCEYDIAHEVETFNGIVRELL